jgi:hypothetical protein
VKIYQVYYILKPMPEYTTYVGTDRAVAFAHDGDNVHGHEVESYRHTGDEWILEHNATERIKKEIAEWTVDMEKTKPRLENEQKAIAVHKQGLAVLTSE